MKNKLIKMVETIELASDLGIFLREKETINIQEMFLLSEERNVKF